MFKSKFISLLLKPVESIILLIISIFTLQSCFNNKPSIGSIEIKSVKNNALKIKFSVETTNDTDAYVRYWRFLNDEKTDSLVLHSPISKHKSKHDLMIVNSNLNTNYFYNIIAQKKGKKKISKTYSFKTTQAIPWVPYFRDKDSITNLSFDGYIHLHSRQFPGYLFILDGNGKLVFYQKNDANFKVSKWTHKETLLGIISNDTLHFTNGKKIIEYDKFGQILFEAETGKKGIDKSFHHEIDLDEKGNIFTLVYDEKEFDLTSIGGTRNDKVRGDGILVLNHNGEKVWEWSVFDVKHPLSDNKILKTKEDWLHANALFKDLDGNYLVSFRNISQIWKIDGKTGNLIWKLGGLDSDFEIPKELVFSGQHHVRFNPKGELLMLDNGNLNFKPGNTRQINGFKHFERNKNSQSRLLKLSLDTINKKVKPVEVINFPKQYFTHSQGSAEYINDNLIVFCSTNKNRIVYTDNQGNLLGVIPLEHSTYRTQYIKELYSTEYTK